MASIANIPIQALRDLVAATAEWQAWTGLSEAASKDRVKREIPAGTARPYAFIAKEQATALYALYPHGTLMLCFEDDIDQAEMNDPDAAQDAFEDRTGLVVEQMITLSETGGHLYVRDIEHLHTERNDPREDKENFSDPSYGDGLYHQAYYAVHFGLEG